METSKDNQEQRTIGYIEGRLEGLATKEYVQEAINKQTTHIDSKFGELQKSVNALNDKQSRITGAADLIKTTAPMLVSVATLIVLILSLLGRSG